MFYRPSLISVFPGPALEVVSELGGQARLPCSLSSPKVPAQYHLDCEFLFPVW